MNQKSKYITGKTKVEVHKNVTVHWSELPQPISIFNAKNWTDSDNDPESPLEADLEDKDE